MVNTKYIPNHKILGHIQKALDISPPQIAGIISRFKSEMHKGLSGEKSSLKMLLAYIDKPSQKEKGRFIGVDIGGTNLRIWDLELKGRGRISIIKKRQFVLKKRYVVSTGSALFDFISHCLKDFVGRGLNKQINLGFTFSFPVRQTGVASGILINWTKDFAAKGMEGKDVVKAFRASLAGQGLSKIKVCALLNDTVATLISRSYTDKNCDIGVILGTGTNACYREKLNRIAKWHGPRKKNAQMIINIEWGNFNKLPLTVYDRQLDNASENQGKQILEKMVSGMYLGEINRLIVKDLISRKIIFGGRSAKAFDLQKGFKSEYISIIEDDSSPDLLIVLRLLKKLGILESSLKDRILLKRICEIVSKRAGHIAAAVLAAVIKNIDINLSRKHTVAIDGAVYEKHPVLAKDIKYTLREIFGNKSLRVILRLTKDGSVKGAAITAATVCSKDEN